MQLSDLTLDGHAYDVRVLANPLEYLTFLSGTQRRPGSGGAIGLEAVLQMDLEHIVDSRADRVHQAVTERLDATVCSCGLVMPAGLDVVTTTGHRDLVTWRPATTAYVVGEARSDPARHGVLCPACLWAATSADLADAHRSAADHRCDAEGEAVEAEVTGAELRRHLRLAW